MALQQALILVPLCLLPAGFSAIPAPENNLLMPNCQQKSMRPRSSAHCFESHARSWSQMDTGTECTDVELCQKLGLDVPKARCSADGAELNLTTTDGTNNRAFYVRYPENCRKPAEGWPFVVFFGWDMMGIVQQRTIGDEMKQIRTQLLEQGIAFLETSMYWNDTYDNIDCNSHQLSRDIISDGSCRSCFDKSRPFCQPLKNWFLCANEEGSWDIQMLSNIFKDIRNRRQGLHLNLNVMAYIGWSVGAQMTSRSIQLGAQGLPFPVPRCAVMISGASYHCYSCPEQAEASQPGDEFQRCNWWFQGSQANSHGNDCGQAFPPFDAKHNQYGVCPGYTLYPNESAWWQLDPTAQRGDDLLLTEAAWDSCEKAFDEHPPVLLVQPLEDTDAYWNAAQNYYEVLARQEGGVGCRMSAGSQTHGPVPEGNLHTINFLLAHLTNLSLELVI